MESDNEPVWISVPESVPSPPVKYPAVVFIVSDTVSWADIAVEPTGNIKKVLDVAKNKQAKKIGGTLVDATTANMMTQVWDKVNDSSKEKMNKMNTKQLINLILKLWDRMGTPRVWLS